MPFRSVSPPHALGRFWPLVLLASLGLSYGWTLGRYFTGEDFLILGRLLSPEGFQVVRDSFTGPWLGIELVQFYRPVATLLLAAEAWLFGSTAWPYHLVHLMVHGLNTLLFFHWARIGPLRSPQEPSSSTGHLSGRLKGRLKDLRPGCAALLFSLYPLHPNTVTFVASFATLFAATFLLSALISFERGRLGHTAGFYLLALGCYEGAAVLPALLLTRDLTRRWFGQSKVRAPRWGLHLGLFALLGGYFALRRLIFGVSLGGYSHMSERLQWPWPWLGDLTVSMHRLVYPNFESAAGSSKELQVIAIFVTLALAAWAWLNRQSASALRRNSAAATLLGLAWVLIAQAPFSFVPVVPGNGRYWYVAVLGVALVVVGATGMLSPRRETSGPPWATSRWGARRWRSTSAITVLATGLLLLVWLPMLQRDLGRYVQAGELTRELQQQVSEARLQAVTSVSETPAAATVDAPPLFLHGYPQWITSASGAPVAKVFHWGLHDALRPPFVARDLNVFPLPSPEAAPCPGDIDTGRALEKGGYEVRRWTPDGLRSLPETAARTPGKPPLQHYQVIIAAGNVRCRKLEEGPFPELPGDFVDAMQQLYDSPIYSWLEVRDRDGQWLDSSVPAVTLGKAHALPDQ